MGSEKSSRTRLFGNALAVFILAALVLISYSNTFHASWHLDDIQNILQNPFIHLKSLSIENLSRSTISPLNGHSLYRPVAMLTFALNWYLGGADVAGYHLFNIALHCFTSLLLYFTILELQYTPNAPDTDAGSRRCIAFLATALWALNPMQVQAVTYIVQRMAGLSAFFYLGGIYCYVKARNGSSKRAAVGFYALCFANFLLAVGSKENAVTLPGSLLLVEAILFRNENASGLNAKTPSGTTWLIVGCLAVGALLFTFMGERTIDVITRGYRNRPFSLSERMLTEPRILVYYLSLLFYPVHRRFSIMREFSLSKSLFDPLTTVAALAVILTLIVAAWLYRKRWPFFSLAILFFFLGHIVESTVIPLELYFEHRNYLPSLLLFVPVASGCQVLLGKLKMNRRMREITGFGFTGILIVMLAASTYGRNTVWATEKSLWMDAMEKAPSYARPYQNVAMQLQREGRIDEAIALYRKSLHLKDPRPALSRFVSLSNLGNLYKKKGDYHLAVRYLSEAVSFRGDIYTRRVRYNLVLCLLNIGQLDEALQQTNLLLAHRPQNTRYLTTQGFILFKKGLWDEAALVLKKALKLNPDNRDGLLTMGMLESTAGRFTNARKYLNTAAAKYPSDPLGYLCLLENAFREKDGADIERNAMVVRSKKGISAILKDLKAGRNTIGDRLVPLDGGLVIRAIDSTCSTGASVTPAQAQSMSADIKVRIVASQD